MSDEVLSRSKLICYFQIDSSLDREIDQLYRPQQLPLCIFHFHYPMLYSPQLFSHFRPYFPPKATPSNLRIRYKDKQLPYDLPIGLFVNNFASLTVSYSEWSCLQPLKLMMISWKRGYTIVNKEGGCDHVFKKLNTQSQMELFRLHMEGRSHGLNRIVKYEGNCIALRIVIQGVVVERKEQRLKTSIGVYLNQVFGTAIEGKGVFSHGILIDLRLTLKELLEEWNYNDGYCYLKIVQT